MSKRLTPKYLTREVAKTVVEMVLNGFMFPDKMDRILSRKMCHIVVLAPSVEDARKASYPDWPNYPVTPICIFETSISKEVWPHEFDVIARCKAQQLWQGQNIDGNTDSIPHLLFPDNTPYWGGVKRHGIVVACSGIQPYFDQMFSGMIADGIKAFARFNFENSDDKKKGRNFLE